MNGVGFKSYKEYKLGVKRAGADPTIPPNPASDYIISLEWIDSEKLEKNSTAQSSSRTYYVANLLENDEIVWINPDFPQS